MYTRTRCECVCERAVGTLLCFKKWSTWWRWGVRQRKDNFLIQKKVCGSAFSANTRTHTQERKKEKLLTVGKRKEKKKNFKNYNQIFFVLLNADDHNPKIGASTPRRTWVAWHVKKHRTAQINNYKKGRDKKEIEINQVTHTHTHTHQKKKKDLSKGKVAPQKSLLHLLGGLTYSRPPFEKREGGAKEKKRHNAAKRQREEHTEHTHTQKRIFKSTLLH